MSRPPPLSLLSRFNGSLEAKIKGVREGGGEGVLVSRWTTCFIAVKLKLFLYLVDVDECTDSSSVCHENAASNNTLGSYRCTWRPGYAGDGNICRGNLNKHIRCEHYYSRSNDDTLPQLHGNLLPSVVDTAKGTNTSVFVQRHCPKLFELQLLLFKAIRNQARLTLGSITSRCFGK